MKKESLLIFSAIIALTCDCTDKTEMVDRNHGVKKIEEFTMKNPENVSFSILNCGDSEDYNIYSTIIKYFFPDRKGSVVIRKSLHHSKTADNSEEIIQLRQQEKEYLIKEFPELDEKSITELEKSGSKFIKIESCLDNGISYELLEDSEIQSVFNDTCAPDCWKIFHSRFPNAEAIISFSGIGYTKRRDMAISIITIHGYDTESYYVALILTSGRWEIGKTLLAVIQ